jgi:fatty acid synthase subunit beta
MTMTERGATDPSIFIQFAGQGVKYMEDLRRLYTQYPEVRPFIHDAVSELNRQLEHYDDSRTRFFIHGLDADKWIQTPETTPGLSYLLSSPLSHPFIYLTQITGYLSVLKEGLDQEKLLAHTHSATGFSTGIVAAVLVSMGLSYDSLCRMALKVLAMFFWQGVRCQESMLRFGVNPFLSEDLYDSPEGSPSCMASISNLVRSKLDSAISSVSDNGNIYPAYELFPGR